MAKRERMSAEKKAAIASLIEMYNIETVQDLQESLKDLFGDTIQEMMEAEFDEQLGYEKSARTEEKKENYRNGHKAKRLKTSQGEVEISVPQDRHSEFEPKVVPKHKRDISGIEQKIINMYARGLTTREISEQIDDIYGFSASAEFVSKVTDRIIPQIEEWQHRALSEVYPIVMIDAIVFHVQRDNMVQKTAVYIVLGINSDGMKEVLSIDVGGSESAKYWLSVLNNLKNRGVRDIFVLCSDALSGIKEAVAAAYPMTEHQLCIVHMVRNTLKHVPDKDRKGYANDLRSIYHAPNEESAREALEKVTEKWGQIYPNSMKRWHDNWSHVATIFKYSAVVRKAIYTTNPIESLNSQYRRINRSRSVFPSEDALKKAIYLATMNIAKKWTNTIRNWGQVYGEFSVVFGDRL